MKAKEIIEYAQQEDFTIMFCAFLDDFYKSDRKYELISEEPIYDDRFSKELSMLSAAVHKLSNDYNLKVPTWAMDKKYFLNKPYYQFDTQNVEYQEYLKNKSPNEYKMRNIFFDDNVLMRI